MGVILPGMRKTKIHVNYLILSDSYTFTQGINTFVCFQIIRNTILYNSIIIWTGEVKASTST